MTDYSFDSDEYPNIDATHEDWIKGPGPSVYDELPEDTDPGDEAPEEWPNIDATHEDWIKSPRGDVGVDGRPIIPIIHRNRGQSHTSRKLAFSELILPPQVDTLAATICPVCASENSYTSDRCSVCGSKKPPDAFMSPDLSVAPQIQDLIDEHDEQDALGDLGGEDGTQPDLICPACEHTFTSGEQDDESGNPRFMHAENTEPAMEEEEELEQEMGAHPGEGTDDLTQAQSPQPEPPGDDRSEEEEQDPDLESGNVSEENEEALAEQQAQDEEGEDSTGYEVGDICPNCGEAELEPYEAEGPEEGQEGEDGSMDPNGNSPRNGPQGLGPEGEDEDENTPFDPGAEEEDPDEEEESSEDDDESDNRKKRRNPFQSRKRVRHEGALVMPVNRPVPKRSTAQQRPRPTQTRTASRQVRGNEARTLAGIVTDSTPKHLEYGTYRGPVEIDAKTGEWIRNLTPEEHASLSLGSPLDDQEYDDLRPVQGPGQERKALFKALNVQAKRLEQTHRMVAQLVEHAKRTDTYLARQATVASTLSVRNEALERQAAHLASVVGEFDHHTAIGKVAFQKVQSIMHRANPANPAQPVQEPNPEGPIVTEQQAMQPTVRADVTQMGATPLTDVSADATIPVDEPYGEAANVPIGLNRVDVTAPVDGTQYQRPPNETIIPVDVRVGDPDDPNPAFPWYMGPTGQPLPPTPPGPSVGNPQIPVSMQKGASDPAKRQYAALRLARLQIQAGIASGEDIEIAEFIRTSSISDESMGDQITLLAKLAERNPNPYTTQSFLASYQPPSAQIPLPSEPGRKLVPRVASQNGDPYAMEGVRSAPSLQGGATGPGSFPNPGFAISEEEIGFY